LLRPRRRSVRIDVVVNNAGCSDLGSFEDTTIDSFRTQIDTNYTEPANEYNDENIFVLGSRHSEVAGVHVEANPCRQLVIHMKQEIERIISLSDPYDPST
jgi:NAD(P)-dependent dehydrogenase (short-subunit alcohol dehydrogenase family)